MTWPVDPRPAKALLALVGEVNTRFPNRSKASDGMLGDAAHATRDSDHNPWVQDGSVGVVTAVDITDGSAPGVPEIADLIVSTLVSRRDQRVKYIIHEGTIWRSYDKPGIPAWTPAPYTGSNGHFQHVHVSVLPEKVHYDSTAPWGITMPATPVNRVPMVNRARVRVAAVNMHAPGPGDAARMRKFLRRARVQGFAVVLLQEFNAAMAAEVDGKWGLHRARPNTGTSGNAVLYWKPVFRFTANEPLPVVLPTMHLTMAGAALTHRLTGMVLPVLSVHNPASQGVSARPQTDRDICTVAEEAWAKNMVERYGSALVGGDFNEANGMRGTPAVAHGVDQIYTRKLAVSSPKVHRGLKPGVTDHAGISTLVKV